jgi:imidazolonepropionase-like amidohydrolase
VGGTEEDGSLSRPDESWPGATERPGGAAIQRDAAALGFDEARLGSIAPGMLADLVVLSADPTAARPGRLADLCVEMTIVEGAVVHP